MTTSIEQNEPVRWRQAIRPALAFTIAAAIGVTLWAVEEHSHRVQMELEVNVTAEQAGRRLSDWIGDRMNLSAYLAAKWEADYAAYPERYRRDVTHIVDMFPGYQAINWIDPEWRIRLVVPYEGNEPVQDVNLHDYPLAEVRAAVARAVDTRQPTRTPAFISLIQGGKGFATYWPIFNADGTHAGFINAVFRVNELVETCLGRIELGQKFEVIIRETGGEVIYSAKHAEADLPDTLAPPVEIPVLDQPWLLYLSPSTAFYTHHHFDKHHLMLPTALLLGIFLATLEHVLGRRKRALRSSQAQYQQLFDHAPVGYISCWPSGIVETSNQVAESLTGYTKETLYGKSLYELFSTEADRAWLRQHIAQIERGRSIAVNELQVRRSEGQLVWCLVSLEGTYDVDGGLSLLRMTLSDVSERKESEQARSRLVAAIEQAEEGMAITGRNGAIQYSNQAFHTINRHVSRHCVGLSVASIFPHGNDDVDIEAVVEEALEKGERWQGAYMLPQRDANPMQVEATVSPLHDDKGVLTNFVLIQRDVTHEAELQDELRQAHKMEAIGRLAGGIAHDFNNILQSLLGYATLARQDLHDHEEVAHCLSEIEQSGRRASELVGHILAFGQKTEQVRGPIWMGPIVEEVLGLLQGSLSPNVQLETDFGPDLCRVVANPTQLHQIVMNLATNGCQAMMPEGGRLRVGLHAVVVDGDQADNTPGLLPGQYMRLEVEDSGAGMSKEVLERVFEPYFTTREQGSGSGLGLAMVHGLVEQHGGAIRVESEVGAGTTFLVYLPVHAESADVDGEAGDSRTVEGDSPHIGVSAVSERGRGRGPRARIMFVDDEAPIVDSMSRILTCFGFEVAGYCDSVAAVGAFRASPAEIDVVITDLSMPELNGIELAQQLKEVRNDIPVILCSGYGATFNEEIERNNDVIRVYLEKPVTAMQLREAIATVCSREGE